MTHFLLSRNAGFRNFLWMSAVFFIAGLVVLLTTAHGDVVLFLNRYSHPALDPVVIFITDLGLGSYLVAGALLLALVKLRYTIFSLSSLALVGIFTPFLKKVVFPGEMRPMHFFYYDDFHRFIHTAELNYFSSFPSGHTMAAFGFFGMLAYLFGKPWAGIACFVFALLIGFSRIYLLQHFFLDVYVGAAAGILAVLMTAWLLDGLLGLRKSTALNQSLIRMLRRKKDEG